MAKGVREPIQVYLTDQERSDLDRLATRLGVSRSEILRRGVSALTSDAGHAGSLAGLVAEGLVTPALRGPSTPQPSQGVFPLREILADLDANRGDR